MTNKQLSLLLLILFSVLYLLPLGVRPLFIQDETRYAEIPREMIATGDWVVPHANGLRYFEKPAMGYWLSAVSLLIFGENNFAVRFPSVLSIGLTALLLFALCRHHFDSRSRVPWMAPLVLLTSLGVAAIGTFAVLDTSLFLFLSATLTLFFLATEEEPGSVHERLLLLVAGIFAGFAFLTKGFLAFMVPVLTAGPYLVLQGRWRELLRLLWLPVMGATLAALPWSLLIHFREPNFWYHFFWNEHVRRFLADAAQHKQPFWFFMAVFPAMFIPWIFLLPAALVGLWSQKLFKGAAKRLMQFSCCWFFFPFLFFSASSGKLVTYILPCFPPLAILTAMGLDAMTQSIKTKIVHYGIIAFALMTALAFILLSGLYLGGPEKTPLHAEQPWKIVLIDGVLVVMFMVLIASLRALRERKMILYALALPVLLLSAHLVLPSTTLNMVAPGNLITRNLWKIPQQTSVLASDELALAACWYLKRQDIYLVEGGGELQYGLNYDDARQREMTPAEAGDFIRKHAGNAVIITTQEKYSRWQPFLPIPVALDSNGKDGFVVASY